MTLRDSLFSISDKEADASCRVLLISSLPLLLMTDAVDVIVDEEILIFFNLSILCDLC